MTRRKFNVPLIILIVAMFVGWGYAVVPENQHQTPPNVQLRHVAETSNSPVIYLYPMRQLLLDSFERSSLSPWVSSGQENWGIRDTTDTYGPQTNAFLGYRYAGHPSTDIPEYPSPGSNPGLILYLTSPTIDLTGIGSLYLSFNYWGDFEGTATNFDGGIVEISPDNGTSWIQIDSLAQGHLTPTYDSRLANSGQLGTAWAYCYDTDPYWISVVSEDLIAHGYVATGNQIRVRFTFAYDALSGGQGWFIDDVRVADTPPPDQQPPEITHTPLTDTPDTLNSYVVSATVIDPGSGVDYDSVYLHYKIEQGSWVDVKMDTIGTGSPDVYEGEIPPQTYHTDIFYNISAADLSGNEKYTGTYNFEVTSAVTIQYDDGQPFWIIGGLVPGDGLFTQFDFSPVGIDSGLLHQVKLYFDGIGNFDLRIYQGSTGSPGALLDSLAGLYSSGYEWYTADITDLNIRVVNYPVAGYIIGPPIGGDTIQVLEDPVLDHPNNMWVYQYGTWNNPMSGGDHMIRLKVIPLPETGVEENTIAKPFILYSLAPNPTRANALIKFQLVNTQKVKLNVYDVTGQLVKTLINDEKPAGKHQVYWNGQDEQQNQVSSGIYFLKFEAGNHVETRKLLLIK
jgi:hypothetical protein